MPANPLISIIDDDESVRKSLAFRLGAAGFRVATYELAMAFLDAPPHIGEGCVVTDIRMPQMDGMELLRRIKSSGRNLQVVVMTGHGDISLAVEAMKLGASDFIEKPFDDETLLTMIRAALNNAEASSQREGKALEIVELITSLTARERAGARWPGGGPIQQDHRTRSRHQSSDRRNLSCQCHEKNASYQPLRTRPDRHQGWSFLI